MIEIRDVTKVYGKEVQTDALRGVSLSFPDKGLVFIVGKSGSGKTTLLNLIAKLDAPTSGTITIDGKTDFTPSEEDAFRNRGVGVIFQELNLLTDFTTAENIALPQKISGQALSNGQIDALLDKVGIKSFKNTPVTRLSVGQKQRVAIARVLAKDAKIILADEPTGSLDAANGKQIFDIFKAVSREKLVIIITHDKENALEYADRIIEIQSGTVASDRIRNAEFQDGVTQDRSGIFIPLGQKFSAELAAALNGLNAEKPKPISFRAGQKFEPFVAEECESGGNGYSIDSLKTHLPVEVLKRFTFSKIKNTKARFVAALVVIAISLTVFGISLAFSSYNLGLIGAEYFDEGDRGIFVNKGEYLPPFDYFDRNETPMTSADLAYFNGAPEGIPYDVVYSVPNDALCFNPSLKGKHETSSGGYYVTASPKAFIETSAAGLKGYGFSITGEFPSSQNEVAITDYAAFVMTHFAGAVTEGGTAVYGVEPTGLIGLTIDFDFLDLTVTGIVNTGFEEYKDVITMSKAALNNSDEKTCLEVESNLYNYWNALFFPKGAHEFVYTEAIINSVPPTVPAETVVKFDTAAAIFAVHFVTPEDKDDIRELINFIDAKGYYYSETFADLVYLTYNDLSIYGKVFAYISILLAVTAALFVVEYMLSSLKDRQSELGIMRAMGVKSADLTLIFVIIGGVILLISAVLQTAFLSGTIAILNAALRPSLAIKYGTTLTSHIRPLVFTAAPFLWSYLLLFGILAVSVIIPSIILAKYKPIKLIKGGN
ncbi:MAG: ABC transporter ATP-binding protein/permease [Christensenellaceae bacterium]|nr:ABC transporter ATP-binding protein/permease [Christensenellaceae bacterium]